MHLPNRTLRHEAKMDRNPGTNRPFCSDRMLHTLLSTISRTFRYKINKEIEELKDIVSQVALTDIDSMCHLTKAGSPVFSSGQGHSPGQVVC